MGGEADDIITSFILVLAKKKLKVTKRSEIGLKTTSLPNKMLFSKESSSTFEYKRKRSRRRLYYRPALSC